MSTSGSVNILMRSLRACLRIARDPTTALEHALSEDDPVTASLPPLDASKDLASRVIGRGRGGDPDGSSGSEGASFERQWRSFRVGSGMVRSSSTNEASSSTAASNNARPFSAVAFVASP